MKYFYAIIYCNSPKTCDKIYTEYNGYEFELSSLKLNLSYVADDLKFPQEVKETATEVPPGYQFRAFNELNRAQSHTQVRLTWDDTDPKRLRKFQKIMHEAADRDDLDDEAYKEFLASHSESEVEDDSDQMDKDKIEEYRRKLLGGLSSDDTRKRDLQPKDSEALDIKFNVGFGEDVGKKILADKKLKSQEEKETAWESYQRKRKEKKKEKKLQAKEHKKDIKKQSLINPEDAKKTAELELLIGKKNNGNIVGDFKANTNDKRFEAVLRDKQFAIDPTHKNFRKVAVGEYIKEQKVKRQKLHE